MTNRIQGGPGGPAWSPLDAIARAERAFGAGRTGGATFQQTLEGAQGAAESIDLASARAEAVVQEVAAELKAGRIADPAEAFSRVVDGLLERSFGGLPDEVRGPMMEAVRQELAHDPWFVVEVEALLGEAMMGGRR